MFHRVDGLTATGTREETGILPIIDELGFHVCMPFLFGTILRHHALPIYKPLLITTFARCKSLKSCSCFATKLQTKSDASHSPHYSFDLWKLLLCLLLYNY